MLDTAIYEDSGPVLSGRGTTTTEITNCNWKRTGTTTDIYWHYPLRRPISVHDLDFSFTKFIFFKLYGTCNLVKNVKITLDTVPGLRSRLYCRLSHIYAQPNSSIFNTLTYLSGPLTLFPNLGSAPNLATTRPLKLTGNIEVYTQYLITKLVIINSDYSDVGNTTPITIKFSYDEFE